MFISAKTGQRVKRVLDAASAASEEHRRRITTSTMNLVLRKAQVCMASLSPCFCQLAAVVLFVSRLC